MQYTVKCVKLETFKQLRGGVTAAMGFIVAVGILQNNIVFALVGMMICMLTLFLARRSVTEQDWDERTVIIRQKSSQVTLSLTITVLAVVGLGLIVLSRQGYLVYEELGSQIAMLVLLIMALKAFFDWYYRKKYGD